MDFFQTGMVPEGVNSPLVGRQFRLRNLSPFHFACRKLGKPELPEGVKSFVAMLRLNYNAAQDQKAVLRLTAFINVDFSEFIR